MDSAGPQYTRGTKRVLEKADDTNTLTLDTSNTPVEVATREGATVQLQLPPTAVLAVAVAVAVVVVWMRSVAMAVAAAVAGRIAAHTEIGSILLEHGRRRLSR